MKFCEPRNKVRKTMIEKCCRPELKGKLTSVANRLQPWSLCGQHSRRNVCLTEPVLTWPLEGGALMNSAMLGEMQAFSTFFLPFYQPLKTEWISSVKVLRDEPDLTSQGVSLEESSGWRAVSPWLTFLSRKCKASPNLPAGLWFHIYSPYMVAPQPLGKLFKVQFLPVSPQLAALPGGVGWGGWSLCWENFPGNGGHLPL